MHYWEHQSNNEIKAQIKLRGDDVLKPIKYMFAFKQDLLNILEQLIKDGKW